MWELTGNRFLVSGGNFLGGTYLGYNKPNGAQTLMFECDSGKYWADEVALSGNANYLFMTDDQFRFFFIPKNDVSTLEPAGEHNYN